MGRGATCTEFRWTNGRGQDMLGVEYLPSGTPKASLLWHHGVCEHSGRYTPGAPAAACTPGHHACSRMRQRPGRMHSVVAAVRRHAAACSRMRRGLFLLPPPSKPPLNPTSPPPNPNAVFQHMAEQGVAVYTFDVHGHGRSQPDAPSQRCLVLSFNDMVRACIGGAGRCSTFPIPTYKLHTTTPTHRSTTPTPSSRPSSSAAARAWSPAP